ncbi:MAG: hypothetical protein ABIB71_07400 [Candidatus Woesearchaeota archaeon]
MGTKDLNTGQPYDGLEMAAHTLKGRKYYSTKKEVYDVKRKGEVVRHSKRFGYYIIRPKKRLFRKNLLRRLLG